MEKVQSFVAAVERDAQVVQAISTTLSVLEMVNELTRVAEGAMYRLDFTSEIDRLSGVLRLMGARQASRGENELLP